MNSFSGQGVYAPCVNKAIVDFGRIIKMAERRKFEEMLERLVNEDAQGAKDLFHEIVVEKSRKI